MALPDLDGFFDRRLVEILRRSLGTLRWASDMRVIGWILEGQDSSLIN